MPMMPSPLGVLPFVAMKLAGYTAFGAYVAREYADFPRSPGPQAGALAVGVTRTIVGVMGGVAYAGALEGIGLNLSPLVLLGALAPMRFLEWAFVLWILFDQRLEDRGLMVITAILGTLVSYALDIPAFGTWWLLPGLPVC